MARTALPNRRRWPIVEFAERLPHLARRFFGVVWAQPRPADARTLERVLSPTERALFRSMSVADQRHSLDLAAKLLADGHDDPDLLAGALLHDVGKSVGSLPVVLRVTYSLTAYLFPRGARWLANGQAGDWRQPFYIAAHHAAIGAELAERAGSQPAVICLIRGHDSPGSDENSNLLRTYDRSM